MQALRMYSVACNVVHWNTKNDKSINIRIGLEGTLKIIQFQLPACVRDTFH